MITEATVNGLMTVNEVAKFAGVTKSSVYQAINRRENPLTAARVMGKLCVLRSDAENYKAECRKSPLV